jgi:uncharacterized RDD family membrane protein YckC
MAELVTGEAVALDLRVARMPSRALAVVLDMLIQYVILNMLLVLSTLTAVIDTALAVGFSILSMIIVLVGYPTAFETLSRGRSVGKMALGLRVVRDDGGVVQFRQALVRALAGVMELWVLAGSPALVSSLFNRQGKRLGDLFAGTIVIQDRVPISAIMRPAAVMPPELMGWAQRLELSGVGDGLALAARQYLMRFWELRPEVRDTMGRRITDQVLARVSPPPPPGMRPEIILSAVLAERRFRDERRLWDRRMRREAQLRQATPMTHGPVWADPRITGSAGTPGR